MRLFSALLFYIFIISSAFAQADLYATVEAKNLFNRLYQGSLDVEKGKIIFGYQNAFTQGRGWSVNYDKDWNGSLPETDLEKVIQKKPALVGYDLLEIGNWNKQLIIKQMREYHKMNGIITLSWHMPNFHEDGKDTNSWDTSGDTARKIISDEKFRKIFYQKLDRLVEFLKDVSDIPVIFRPFHEHNYSWFWWGQKFTSNYEYKMLWKILVDYLKQNGIHNLLYAYSPNYIEGNYLDKYPGNELVDILGVDMYFKDSATDASAMGPFPQYEWKRDVIRLVKLAHLKKKIPAITEFGNEAITYNNFWTDYFAWPIEKAGMDQFTQNEKTSNVQMKVAYIMLWRNDPTDPKHFFVPYPGQYQNSNFLMMFQKNIFEFID